LPSEEDIVVEIKSDLNLKCSVLSMTVSKPGWIIKGYILNNEQLFSETGGGHVSMQTVSQNTVSVQLSNAKFTEQ